MRDSSEAMSTSKKYARLYKVILLGEMGVGKTSIMRRWGSDYTREQILTIATTVGVDSLNKEIDVDGIPLKLSVYDLAGQDRFRTAPIVRSVFRNAEAVIFVYDVTSQVSFDKIRFWFDECEKNDVVLSSVPCAVFANKCDMPNPVVTEEMGKKFANDRGMFFCHSSALLDSEKENIDSIFMELGRMLKFSKRQLSCDADTIVVRKGEPSKKNPWWNCPWKWPWNWGR